VSGASVRDAVEALATDLAAQSRTRTDALARSVEVRAAAPLGACFLPAFVLLGVVPMIVGVFGAMSLFG
jgi:pilus assembly protein TadC